MKINSQHKGASYKIKQQRKTLRPWKRIIPENVLVWHHEKLPPVNSFRPRQPWLLLNHWRNQVILGCRELRFPPVWAFISDTQLDSEVWFFMHVWCIFHISVRSKICCIHGWKALKKHEAAFRNFSPLINSWEYDELGLQSSWECEQEFCRVLSVWELCGWAERHLQPCGCSLCALLSETICSWSLVSVNQLTTMRISGPKV